jgi:hypothetical protein
MMGLQKGDKKYKATVELDGIAISKEKERFKLDNLSITLRQPSSKEARFDERGFVTSIMEIEGCFGGYEGLEKSIEQAITILRLFNVGSVVKIWVTRSSGAIPDYGGGKILATSPHIAPERYEIQDDDIRALHAFWEYCWDVNILDSLNIPKQEGEFLEIAYKRYCDALFMPNTEEGRIASIVMGMESIFVPEREELAFRLKTRIGKVFGILGFDGSVISSRINSAYSIRSDYVHGDYIKPGRKKDIEEYGGISSHITYLANILRASILVFLFLEKTSKKKREELIKVIDEGLVDNRRDQELRDQMAKLRSKIPGVT